MVLIFHHGKLESSCSTPAYGVLVGNAPTQPNAMPAQVLAIPKMSA